MIIAEQSVKWYVIYHTDYQSVGGWTAGRAEAAGAGDGRRSPRHVEGA